MIATRLNAVFGPWSDIWLRGGWRVQTHCVTGQARAFDPQGACIAAGEKEICLAAAARLAPSTPARANSHAPRRKKFFGSFFQKRTFFP